MDFSKLNKSDRNYKKNLGKVFLNKVQNYGIDKQYPNLWKLNILKEDYSEYLEIWRGLLVFEDI